MPFACGIQGAEFDFEPWLFNILHLSTIHSNGNRKPWYSRADLIRCSSAVIMIRTQVYEQQSSTWFVKYKKPLTTYAFMQADCSYYLNRFQPQRGAQYPFPEDQQKHVSRQRLPSPFSSALRLGVLWAMVPKVPILLVSEQAVLLKGGLAVAT
jgi:hypothetical protein